MNSREYDFWSKSTSIQYRIHHIFNSFLPSFRLLLSFYIYEMVLKYPFKVKIYKNFSIIANFYYSSVLNKRTRTLINFQEKILPVLPYLDPVRLII